MGSRAPSNQEDAATPDGVPAEYVMQPFSIRLAFRGRHWLTVAFELGHDEIGSTESHDLRIADDLITLFEILGLEAPAPIPVLALDHQIAQKLHACTYVNPKTGQNDRAHDLVDLQILAKARRTARTSPANRRPAATRFVPPEPSRSPTDQGWMLWPSPRRDR